MRLHRFFVDFNISQTEFGVKNEHLIHQWRHVFRYNTGSELILFDGSGYEYDCLLKSLSNREALCEVIRSRKGVLPKREITLYQSIIKKDKMEWIVEKATELGVSKIVPILSERSEKKDLNLERMQKITIEAAEQCDRADVPIISDVTSLDEALKYCENAVTCDLSGSLELKAESLKKTLSSKLKPLSLFVGPEGGWSEGEIKRFKEAKIEIFSLGKLTLRAETAAIVALGFLVLPGLGE
jgi:16S rRNA (uracil1498-N3)-methyltransferase